MPELFHNWKGKIKGLFGGNRSGKTEEGAEYTIDRCIEKPKQRWWACAETFKDSVDIQQRKVWKLLPKDEVKYAYYDEINGFRHRKVIFKNESVIIFKSYDQGREAFQSEDLDGIWNDEETPYDIYKEQRMRLIDRDGEMVFTMTSLKGITELMSELFDEHDVIESQYCPELDEDLPRVVQKNSARFFLLWTTENPYVNQVRLRGDMKDLTRTEIRSRVFGMPTVLSGRIYPTFNKQFHVVGEDFLPTKNVTLYHILDPHDAKPWAMSWWVVDKRGWAYCVREYPWKKNFNEMTGDDNSYEDYKTIIQDMEDELFDQFGRTVYRRIIDPNFGHKTIQKAKSSDGTSKTTPVKILKEMGFKFYDANDDIQSGHLAVRKRLRYEIRDGIMTTSPRMYVYEECENTVRHMSRYSYKDLVASDGDNRATPQLTQKYKDFSDLVRYGVMDGFTFVEPLVREPREVVKRY